jgi:hypothetical protein
MTFNKKNQQLNFRITASCLVFALVVILFSSILMPVQTVHAQTADETMSNLDQVAGQTVLKKDDPVQILARIIKIALSLLGAVALIIFLYAGFVYMTSGGDPEKINSAKMWMKNAIIGLAIILMSYSITIFLFNMLLGNNTAGPTNPSYALKTAGLPGGGYNISGGAFGEIIQSHFPAPDQKGLPRNTMILVTFKSPVDVASVIDVTDNGGCPEGVGICGTLQEAAFRVFSCGDMLNQIHGEDNQVNCENSPFENIEDDDKLVPGYAMMTEDHQTIIFNPYGDFNEHLGSPDQDVSYLVYLSGSIMDEATPGKSAFPTSNPDYKWRFTTGTFLDLTPPQVSSVLPNKTAYPVGPGEMGSCSCPNKGCSKTDCNGTVYLNQGIYINFNEPVMPPLSQTQDCTDGPATADNEVQLVVGDPAKLVGCDSEFVPGTWKVGINQYRTVQFSSSTACAGGAINSCGEPAFCLPENATLTGRVVAAEVLEAGIALPGSGIMDMAGNSLDGNVNGTADGPGSMDLAPDPDEAFDQVVLEDNWFWAFVTGNTLDLEGPVLNSLDPNNKAESVDVMIPINGAFNEDLDAYTVDTEILIKGVNSKGDDWNAWYDPNLGTAPIEGEVEGEVVVIGQETLMDKITMVHGPFEKYEVTDENLALYNPIIRSELKDSRFNCFSPSKEVQDGVASSHCGSNGALTRGDSCCPTNQTLILNEANNTIECALPVPPPAP